MGDGATVRDGFVDSERDGGRREVKVDAVPGVAKLTVLPLWDRVSSALARSGMVRSRARLSGR